MDESPGTKCVIKMVYTTPSELKQFLMAGTATANQGMKVANTALLAEAEEFSSRGEFGFFQDLKTVLPGCSNRFF